jgi:hypothetical protein
MCEPAHSVVQYDPNDSDNHFNGMDMGSILSKMGSCAKRVGRWFHLSKMGAGHSQATMMGRRQLLYLPEGTPYEGSWWNKGQFEYDGWHNKPDQERIDAAEEYHKRACIGSMQIFRRFFEESMKKSSRPSGYIERFVESVMVKEARDKII